MTRRPVAYLRRSASNDPTREQSREAQEASVRRLAHGADLDLFVDWGLSGGKANRPEYQRLRQEIAGDRVSVVYSYSLSRLGRSTLELLDFFELCRIHGTTVETEADGRLGADTAMGKMLLTIMSAVATFEREVAAERSAAARKIREARGDERRRYGYRLARNGDGAYKRERNPEEPIEPLIQAYLDAGTILGACNILEERDIPTPKGRKRWATSALTRIIERERPDLLPRQTRTGRRIPASATLAHLVVCPFCDTTMTPNTVRRQYYCRNGARDRAAHPRYVVNESDVLPFVKDEMARLRVTAAVRAEAADAAREAALSARLDRASEMYVRGVENGGWTKDRYEREVADVASERSKIVTRSEVRTVEPIDWDEDEPGDINETIRTVLSAVVLGPDMRPVDAIWRDPSLRG